MSIRIIEKINFNLIKINLGQLIYQKMEWFPLDIKKHTSATKTNHKKYQPVTKIIILPNIY